MKDTRLNIIFILFLLLFGVIVALVFFDNPIKTITQAGQNTVAINKSLILASKLEAIADNQDFVEITVFARNNESTSLQNKTITLTTTHGLLNQPSGITDRYGKVVFLLTANAPGEAEIATSIEGQPLNQPLVIKFNAPPEN